MNEKKARVMHWIQKKGARPCCDPKWSGMLLEYLMPVADAFPDFVRQVSAWYCYWILDQEGAAIEGEPDGICWKDVIDGGSDTLYAVGISCEALATGREYVQLLILHELTHMLTDESHTVRFHETLNGLINQYNAVTGSKIANDFCGIKTRYDSRPWTLPDDIPKQQSRRGSAFRTEAKR